MLACKVMAETVRLFIAREKHFLRYAQAELGCSLNLNLPLQRLFTSKKFYKIETIVVLFVLDKYCPIMN